MDTIVVADKSSSEISAKVWGDFQLARPGVVQMPVTPSQVATVNRSGQDLIVTLKSGERVTVGNFFTTADDVRSDMVFQGEDGALWQAQYSSDAFTGFTFDEIASLDALLADTGVITDATQTWAFAGLGLLGAGGAAAAAGGGGGDGNGGGGDASPSLSAPSSLNLSADGLTLQGSGTAGSTINVRDLNGQLLGTGTVGPDGNFTVPLNTPQTDGQSLQVDQTDPTGSVSAPIQVTAPDTTPPGAPGNLQLSADGLTLSGTGEAGATVSVRDASGNLLGSALVNADGAFTTNLNSAQLNGQTLSVELTDAAGNTSSTDTIVAPNDGQTGPGDPGTPDNPGTPVDVSPPAVATNLAINANGTLLSGRGEAGALVRVVDSLGNLLGTGQVGSDGLFNLTLNPAQTDGQSLNVTLIDAAGNVSNNANVSAPDLDPGTPGDTTAPSAPTGLAINANGTLLSGRGEPIAARQPDHQ